MKPEMGWTYGSCREESGRKEECKHAHTKSGHLLKIRVIGNDRPTVAHVVRAMEHPMNSYRDLDFLVDPMAAPKDIHKAFLYSDDTKDNAEIIDHLNDRVYEDYRSRGLVRP
jgi:hypothetical protein